MFITCILHINFYTLPVQTYVLCKLLKWMNTEFVQCIDCAELRYLAGQTVAKNRILNNNSSVRVPNDHGKHALTLTP